MGITTTCTVSAELVAAFAVPVFAHGDEVLNELTESYSGSVTRIAHGEQLEIGAVDVELIHTPGHTFGSVTARAGGHLFTGDAMMIASMGRPGSTYDHILAMWESAQRVFQPLGDDMVVHPGHDAGPSPLATMAEQRQRIPALRAATLDEFIDAMERETNRILRPTVGP